MAGSPGAGPDRPDPFAFEKKEGRDAGEVAAIALALEIHADALVKDDGTGRKEAAARGLRALWMLQVLDAAAERGLVLDLSDKLDHLETRPPFYLGARARAAVEAMRSRDRDRRRDA